MSSNLYHWTKRERAGLVILVSNDIATSTIPRLDLNKKGDTIPTVWIQLKNLEKNLDLIIGGVYCRSRASADVMKTELHQLHQQILCAAQKGKSALVLGDMNLDHNNPHHSLSKEANDLLAVVDAAMHICQISNPRGNHMVFTNLVSALVVVHANDSKDQVVLTMPTLAL